MGFIKSVKTFFQSSSDGPSSPSTQSPRNQPAETLGLQPTSCDTSTQESSLSATNGLRLPPLRGSSARENSHLTPAPPKLDSAGSLKSPNGSRARSLVPAAHDSGSPRNSISHCKIEHHLPLRPHSPAPVSRCGSGTTSGRGSTPTSARGSAAGAPPPGIPSPGAGPAGMPLFRRLHRQNSVPIMMHDYGSLGLHKLPLDTAGGLDAAGLKTALAASVLARLEGPLQRQHSLKALLNLSQYDFVSDVNVSEAQLLVDPLLSIEANAILASGAFNNLLLGGRSAIFSEVTTLTDTADDLEDEDFRSEVNGINEAAAAVAAAEASGAESNVLAVSVKLPVRMRRTQWSINDFKLQKQLHKGYASEVFQAKCLITGEMVALKVYRLADQCDLQRVQLYREIALHSKLQHHNVVQFYASFLEDNCVIIVQEFCAGGDLLKIMYKCGGRLFERQAVNLVLQPFLTSLQYLHTIGIVHRDIKPENVLFTEDKVLKLADFGLAIDLNEERANTRAGTLDYMAPEVLRCPTKKTPDEGKANAGSAHYHTGVDAWAVGVFAYELVTGTAPFKAGEMIETARNIIHAQVEFPSTVSELACDFIASALAKHPGDRPTVIEMLRHPWITMFQRRASVLAPSTASHISPEGS